MVMKGVRNHEALGPKKKKEKKNSRHMILLAHMGM
jgi:hypothetical protein